MARETTAVGGPQTVALPLHLQKLESLLNLAPLLGHIESLFKGNGSNWHRRGHHKLSDVQKCLEQAAASDARVYNFSVITEERKWVQDLLLSDSEDSESDLSEAEQAQLAMELHYRKRKRWRRRLRRVPKLWKYRYFSAGLLMTHDHYPEHVKSVEQLISSGEARKTVALEIAEDRKREEEHRRHLQKEKERYRIKLWAFIAKKEIPKMAKQFATARHNVLTNSKRVAQLCQREVRRTAQKSQRASKEVTVQPRARRLMREALMYWRRYERTEKEQRRKAEREAVEQRKIDDEMREAKRQQRKLNFLITQTELYAHFMAKKLTGSADQSGKILKQLDDAPLQREVQPGVVVSLESPGEYDSDAMKAQALANVEAALLKQVESQHLFDKKRAGASPPAPSSADLQESFDNAFSLATPVLYSERELPQPRIFKGTLKAYQLKGMNWLANLYDQGINGILADEMGLGKTVESIALMAHLAERQNIWGPFLVVAPASTLHNWQQECSRFLPRLKVLPYWGSPHERKIIRKYWNPKMLFKESAPFHILVTSYQLVVQDVKYFHRVKWQYMILDEAQAIKSSSSMRWKVLLSFSCRNRLLLTGTPIQNTMQELWALLHFIMPTMFDSHEEFNEWFSRDIESHAERRSGLDENQLSRLHMILKPFMLRRIKRDVEHEMAEKIEVHLSCELSMRQKRLYHGLRQRISVEDLLQSSYSHSSLASHSSKDSSSSHLLNLVMQFRKVCNHPDLFERRDVVSPLSLSIPSLSLPRLVYHQLHCRPTQRHRLLSVVLGVHTAHHIYQASVADQQSNFWSFLRLTAISPQEISTIMLGPFTNRLRVLIALMNRAHLLYRQRLWQSRMSGFRYQSTQLVLWPDQRVSFAAIHNSTVLSDLVFTAPSSSSTSSSFTSSSSLYTHTTHCHFPLKTTSQAGAELTEISSMISGSERGVEEGTRSTPTDSRLASVCGSPLRVKESGRDMARSRSGSVPNGFYQTHLPPSLSSPSSSSSSVSLSALCQDHSTVSSPAKLSFKQANTASSNDYTNNMKSKMNGGRQTGSCNSSPNEQQNSDVISPCRTLHCVPTDVPKFLLAYVPTVEVPLNPLYCSDRVAEYHRQQWLRGGPTQLHHLLLHGAQEGEGEGEGDGGHLLGLLPSPCGGLECVRSPNGWSHIVIPDKDCMIYDSGKMAVLDKLLAQLKREGHRVLIYSQMTRMIDLLEEFMAYRRYRCIRLDGSSRISDRRDMVDDFQNKSDIFVFLLSTRAGGLGINLTAADTVIFYDSDWNPTVDQQAMDRAHRLGQTKQVTVYRLVVKGSIEERILQRAREKSEIQKMVISGGDFKPDALKPKEMVSLLLDDDEMETRFLAKQAEKLQEQELGKRPKGKKRKNLPNGRESEPLAKRPNISSSPSPLVLGSRPASVLSGASSDMVVNGDLAVDIVGGGEGPDDQSYASSASPSTHPEKHRGRTSAPLGGRGKFQKRKGFGGGGSMSAAASAGAMAGALAASNATFATLGYSLPSNQVSPSPSNSLSAYPASAQGNSAQSSPRASPIPVSLSQTPPSTRLLVPRTLVTHSKNS